MKICDTYGTPSSWIGVANTGGFAILYSIHKMEQKINKPRQIEYREMVSG